MLVFFTNLSLMEYQVRFLVLFLLFSVIDGFKWFWMGSLQKNIPLILGPTLFRLYINDLLVNVICDNVICGYNLNWLLNLNLIYETLWTGAGSSLLIFNAGKTQMVLFDRSINTGAIDVKMDRSFFEEKSSFKMLGLTFSSKLDWGSYITSIAKTSSKEIVALVCSFS